MGNYLVSCPVDPIRGEMSGVEISGVELLAGTCPMSAAELSGEHWSSVELCTEEVSYEE